MRQISKLFILFALSVLLILSMPFLVSGEDWAVYGNETNVSYPDKGINCSFGQVHPNQSCYWCWINFSQKVMDHSFMSFEAMDAYYNPGEGLIIDGNETFSLSLYQPSVITTPTPETKQPNTQSEYSFTLYDIVGYIRGFFL